MLNSIDRVTGKANERGRVTYKYTRTDGPDGNCELELAVAHIPIRDTTHLRPWATSVPACGRNPCFFCKGKPWLSN